MEERKEQPQEPVARQVMLGLTSPPARAQVHLTMSPTAKGLWAASLHCGCLKDETLEMNLEV